MYDGKSVDKGPAMEHAGKDTYIRDIYVFLDRVKDIVSTRGAQTVRTNLHMCLRGEAFAWYTSILSEEEKRLVKYGVDNDDVEMPDTTLRSHREQHLLDPRRAVADRDNERHAS